MRNKLVKATLSLVLAASLVLTGAVPSVAGSAEAANDGSARAVSADSGTVNRSKMEKEHAEISKRAAEEGIVLLENENEVLPVAEGTKAAVFGTGSYASIKGGTGSGDVYNKYTITIYDGLQSAYRISNQTWWKNYINTFNAKKQQAASEKKSNDYVTFVKGSFGGADSFLAIDQPLSQADMDSAKANGVDTAFYTVSRTSGEGADRAIDKGEYYLSDVERANLELMAKNFDKTIVLLNVGGIVDTKFFEEIKGLDSLVLVSQAGMEGGTAVENILTGAVTPSGKLSDTWAVSYEDYPASKTIGDHDKDQEGYDANQEDYTEGIYVGYRYFDSFGIKPAYEFGYGKSYTDFAVTPVSVEANADTVNVTVNVKNTGTVYSGKEVVQVYFSAPDGTIEKPYQELAGFAKTDMLAPGASQNLTVSYKTTEMSSYSEEKAAYIMEDGDYVIRVGNSSRNTKAAAVLTLEKDVITEQLSNQLEADKKLDELSAAGASSYSYAGEAAEIAAAKRIALAADSFKTVNNASGIDENAVTTYLTAEAAKDYTPAANEKVETVPAAPEGTKLIDVYKGKVSMESFIAGLTNKQMANIVNGISGADTSDATDWGSEANSVQGAAGETTGNYGETLGIPNTVEADGPAGVRVTEEADNATAFPIGTLLAQTWNIDILTEVGRAIGREMNEFGVTLWLAPGMNIHRDPMNGRNFEYYSEDPALTGFVGSCITAGVQSNPGVGVTIKHFITNNQETNRNGVNTSVSERALREIYLKGFEMVVKSAQPMAIMSSYNKVNGTYAAENFDLLESIPRGEWGFDGMVMTDWGAGGRAGVSGMMHAGNDLVMPGRTQERVVNALAGTPSHDLDKDKALILGDVQKCVGRVLTMIMRSLQFGRMYSEVEVKAHTSTYDNLATYLTSAKGGIVTKADEKADELEKKISELETTIGQLNKDLAAKDTQAQGATAAAQALQKQIESLQKQLGELKFTSQTVNLKKASGKKKSIAVSWKKISDAEGYEISYATKSNFKKAKKVSVGKKVSSTVKKLKAKQKYYVRVRAYKKVDGKKIYTQYSNVKTVKTK
ncbi:glycoside hydrolase family 3 N-terminal domain-containing protein [Lachnospiraceae bacterium 45-W7]